MSSPNRRGRNLDDKSIEEIAEILDGWPTAKLTWDLLIKEISLRMRVSYTRQALNNHTRIKEAFVARKRDLLLRQPITLGTVSLEFQRIARLEAENARLRRENNNLLEQFQRWVYNGYLKQMDERMRECMNEALPQVHRDRS